jgi:hypothetical protein
MSSPKPCQIADLTRSEREAVQIFAEQYRKQYQPNIRFLSFDDAGEWIATCNPHQQVNNASTHAAPPRNANRRSV